MAVELTTRILGEGDYPLWTTLVTQSPDGSVYSRPDYVESLCRAAGGHFRVLVAERNGGIVGGITLYERQSRLGPWVHPRPLLYYNGIVRVPHACSHPSQQTSWSLQTLVALEKALVRARYVRLRIKSRASVLDVRVFRENGWQVEPTYTYVVNLSDLPAAWARVEKNLHRLIGRCRESGLVVETSDDFDAFFHLHEQTHVRKGAPLYLPYAAFRGFFEELRAHDLCRLYHARLPDGHVVASQLVLTGAHPVTHTAAAGADAQFLSLGASAFLRWHAFELLAREGHAANDLTDAALGPVTHFKSQFGGDLQLSLELSRSDHVLLRLGTRARAAGTLARRAARRMMRGNRKDDA